MKPKNDGSENGINGTPVELRKIEWRIIGGKKKWIRICPKCNKEINYSSKSKLCRSIKTNTQCKNCWGKLLKIKNTKYNEQYSLVRKCHKCEETINYRNKYNYLTAIKNNTCCKKCRFEENRNDMTGKSHSILTKEKLYASLKGKNTWSRGTTLSEIHKLNISKANNGHKVYSKTKEKMSLSARGKNTWSKGRKHTEEYKKLMRQRVYDRLLRLGIKSCEDEGAKEFFNKTNKELNYKFELNCYFNDLGYFADAYDKYNHIWAEYDTKYHKYYKQKEKDIIRQNIIIEHFKSIGNPLKQFIRIDVTNNNKTNIIYESK